MNVFFKQDYPVGTVSGNGGTAVPAALAGLPVNRLRWDGAAVVDAASYTHFFIDDAGLTHIIQHDGQWQPLECGWDDELIDDGSWRVVTNDDRLAAAVAKRLGALKTECSAAINAGFISPALGSDHRYDTDKPTDQLNLIAVGLGGVDLPFTCTDLATETKQQRPHTATQLAMVYAEASAEKVRLLGLLDVARTALNAIVITTTLTAALVEVDAVTADFSLPS